MILAIDTSLGSAVAVVDLDGITLGEASSPNALGHAEIIGTLLKAKGQITTIPPTESTFDAQFVNALIKK